MNGPALHKTAADRAPELPVALLDHSFGDNWELVAAGLPSADQPSADQPADPHTYGGGARAAR
ncbi:hypothetical protein [Nonomuraea candida]|uniref:hypothetical protein n=1 Tax=Nonomuraea candida TaxID=359159 RepID=UPI0005BB0D45|nr:hypothetical protein [Nonomuraea candida]